MSKSNEQVYNFPYTTRENLQKVLKMSDMELEDILCYLESRNLIRIVDDKIFDIETLVNIMSK